MVNECVCCGARVELISRRPLQGLLMRMFVSARTNAVLSDAGWICNGCRMLFFKWKNKPEFADAFARFEETVNDVEMVNKNYI